jgi:type VI protein secretion system component VasK
MPSVFRTFPRLLTAALIFALTPSLALAYVGPGAGISMLGALWGLIVGVVMALGVILFWPIRMMIRKMKANKAPIEEAAAGTADDAAGSGEKTADNSTAS